MFIEKWDHTLKLKIIKVSFHMGSKNVNINIIRKEKNGRRVGFYAPYKANKGNLRCGKEAIDMNLSSMNNNINNFLLVY